MARKRRSRTPGVIASGLQEIQTAVKKIARHASTARDRFVADSPTPQSPPPPNDWESESCSASATSQCCQEYFQRVIVEIALLNLLFGHQLSDPVSFKSDRDQASCNWTMAPPPTPSVAANDPSVTPGLLRFMSPVQDLGRSFIGFLLGGAASAPGAQAATNGLAAAESVRKPAAASNAASRKRDSVISVSGGGGGGGRPRPPGHPANPSSHSTPIVIRRTTKPEPLVSPASPGVQQHSLGMPGLIEMLLQI